MEKHRAWPGSWARGHLSKQAGGGLEGAVWLPSWVMGGEKEGSGCCTDELMMSSTEVPSAGPAPPGCLCLLPVTL